MPKIIKSSKLGDAAILKQIINILKKEKIQTVSSNKFTPEISLPKEIIQKLNQTLLIKKIYFVGKKLLKSQEISHLFKERFVEIIKLLALEGSGGTQKMIKKVKKIAQSP